MTMDTTPVHVGTRLFPTDTIPSGWYQIGWSNEFAAGETKPLHYFEQALVAFRAEGGELRVLDAYCPHMGAHLGHGGTVIGDEIVCPYHGWRWAGADGANTLIPYGDRDHLNVSIRCWPTHEVDGIALVHYSPSRSAPQYQPPERFCHTDGELWEPNPEATTMWRDVALVPQLPAENVPDAAHFTYIHGSPQSPVLASFESGDAWFRANWELTFGDGRGSTWATPAGPVAGRIRTESWGLGLGWNVQYAFDEITSLSGYTPIDRYSADVRLTVWAPTQRSDREPTGRRSPGPLVPVPEGPARIRHGRVDQPDLCPAAAVRERRNSGHARTARLVNPVLRVRSVPGRSAQASGSCNG